MTESDPKRTAKACRFYGILLRLYPNFFRQEYGEILSLHFRDEYRNALALNRHSSILRFWVFILFDFLRSLLMEVQEEVVKMFKKYFFVFCAVAAGLATLLYIPFSSSSLFSNDKVDMWSQLLFWPILIGCSSLALFAIAKVTESHLFFRILAILLLVIAASFLPIPYRNPPYGWVGRPAFTYLYNNEDIIFGYFIMAYFLLIGTIIIVAFVKKKWLPGVSLLAICLPIMLPLLVNSLVPESSVVMNVWDSNWYPILFVSLSVIAWFTIAWWLKKDAVSDQILQTA